jgi:hypothetical protein
VIPQPFAKLVEHCSAIMPIATEHLGRLLVPLALCGGAALAQPSSENPALLQIRGGGTPAVFKPGTPVLPASSCPAIVSVGDIQPMRLPPSEVAAKNKLGCLSPNDAVYGPDGCPSRLCGQSGGTVALPQSSGG